MPKYISPDQPEGLVIEPTSMAARIESQWIDLFHFQTALIQISWQGGTGTIDGNLFLECSNNTEKASKIQESVAVMTAADDEQSYNVWVIPGRYLRVVYEPNSITGGTIQATCVARGL